MNRLIRIILIAVLLTSCGKGSKKEDGCTGIECARENMNACENSLPGWHLEAHGEPVVREFLKKQRIAPKLGILDHTFSKSAAHRNNSKLFLPEEYDQNYSFVDYQTHGDLVSYFVNGRFGYSPSAEVALIPFWAMDYSHDTSRFEIGVMAACEQGYTTINFSGMDDVHFRQKYDIKQFGPRFLNNLKEKGCILVQASGNAGFGAKTIYDDPLVMVGALDTQGNVAHFSSLGEVYAHGKNVYNSQKATNPICGNTMEGTSASSIIIASMLANARAILDNNTVFSKKSPSEKVDVLIELLNSSKYPDSKKINYPLLISKASGWPKESTAALADETEANWQDCYTTNVDRCLASSLNKLYFGSHQDKLKASKELADFYKGVRLTPQALYYIRIYTELKGLPFRNLESISWAKDLNLNTSDAIPMSDPEANLAYLTLKPDDPSAEAIWGNTLFTPQNRTVSAFVRPSKVNRESTETLVLDFLASLLEGKGEKALISFIDSYGKWATSELEKVHPHSHIKTQESDHIKSHQESIYFYLLLVQKLIHDKRFNEVHDELKFIQSSQLESVNKEWLIPLKPISGTKEHIRHTVGGESIEESLELSAPDGFDPEMFGFLYDKNKEYIDSLLTSGRLDEISGLVIQVLLWREYKSGMYPALTLDILEHISNRRVWFENHSYGHPPESTLTGIAAFTLFYYQESNGINESLQTRLKNILRGARNQNMLTDFLSLYGVKLRSNNDLDEIVPDRWNPLTILVSRKTYLTTLYKTMISLSKTTPNGLKDIYFTRYRVAMSRNKFSFLELFEVSDSEIDTQFTVFKLNKKPSYRFSTEFDGYELVKDPFFEKDITDVFGDWYARLLSKLDVSNFELDDVLYGATDYTDWICESIAGTATYERLEQLTSEAKALSTSDSRPESVWLYLSSLEPMNEACKGI